MSPDTASELVDQLKKSKKLYDEFSETLNKRYLISGKLMSDWREYFKISLPPDPTTTTLQSLDSKLLDLHQEAAFMKAASSAKVQAAKHRNTELYRTKYTQLVAEYKSKNLKLPAKDTLQLLAEKDIEDLKGLMLHAEIELDFWKEILADLANSRKLIDNATLNLGIESKALSNQKYLDSLSAKEFKHRHGGSNE